MTGQLELAEFFERVLVLFETVQALSEQAIYTLRDLNDPRAIGPMIQKYPNLKDHMIFEELRSLQTRRKASPLLVERLGSDDAEVRWRACYCLAESGDAQLIPYVERLVHDDERVREAAANMGFGMKGDDCQKIRPALIPLLADQSVSVKVFVACCFAQEKDAASAPTLLELLKDESIGTSNHGRIVRAIQSLTGTYFGYHVGSDAWQPTTANNREAIARFAEWVASNTNDKTVTTPPRN